jgi:ABC-type polysaccharide/polyol phosphate transport system ATPase subunit
VFQKHSKQGGKAGFALTGHRTKTVFGACDRFIWLKKGKVKIS